MTKTKFTPAPWETTYNGFFWDINQDNIKGYNPIASGISCVNSHDNKLSVSKVAKANAALIAVAPEMYEMLKSISDNLEFDIRSIEHLLKKARGGK